MNTKRSAGLLLAALCSSLFTGCIGSRSNLVPPASPLAIRALQTRTYEGVDSKAALKTVLNVLQDEGFMADYGNTELGLLHATRTEMGTPDLDGGVGIRPGGGTILIATVNVSEFGDRVKVRVSFHGETVGMWGDRYSSAPNYNPELYQSFFAKLDRSMFIHKQGL